MSTYKEISGKTIKQLSSDPTSSEFEGQIWFNTTAGVFKSVVASGAWASDSSLVTARQATSAAGTMSAMFAAGGSNEPAVATNEHYNGSGWSSAEALPAGRAGSGLAFGTQTAGVYFCGTSADPATRNNDTYEYDGTNWTGGGAYPTSLTNLGSSGTLTAGLGFGGDPVSAVTAEYNGTSWTASGSLNTAREGVAFSSAGTQTASLCAGGYNNPPGPRTNVEAYDGSSWSEVNDLPVARSSTSGAGTETNTIVIGGEISTGITNTCVQYDGTNWAAIPSMATARFQTGTAGPGTGALAISGSGPGLIPTNEQYNFTTNTITAAAWASGGNLNTARNELMGAKEGTQTAALAAGGGTTGPSNLSNASEEYNGTSWTEGNNLNTARTRGGSAGTQTAGLIFGGTTSAPVAPGASNTSEEYDGTSYSEGNNLNTARLGLGGSGGPQTAAIGAGGYDTSARSTATEEYDGTSWTNGGSLPTATNDAGGAGTSAAMIFGGGNVSPGNVNTVFAYDGSSWTTSPTTLTYSVRMMASSGSSTAAIFSGGEAPSDVATVNRYDGTVFATAPSLATARGRLSGAGTSAAAIVYGGDPPGNAATEEFTGETTSSNIVDITTS